MYTNRPILRAKVNYWKYFYTVYFRIKFLSNCTVLSPNCSFKEIIFYCNILNFKLHFKTKIKNLLCLQYTHFNQHAYIYWNLKVIRKVGRKICQIWLSISILLLYVFTLQDAINHHKCVQWRKKIVDDVNYNCDVCLTYLLNNKQI